MKNDDNSIEDDIRRIEANIGAAHRAMKTDSVSRKDIAITSAVFVTIFAGLIYLYHRLFPGLDGDLLQALTWSTLTMFILVAWFCWKLHLRSDMKRMEKEERRLSEHLANKDTIHHVGQIRNKKGRVPDGMAIDETGEYTQEQ